MSGVWLPRGWAGDELDICMCRCGLVHAELLHSPLLWQLHNAGEERQGEEARPDFQRWLVLDAERIMRRFTKFRDVQESFHCLFMSMWNNVHGCTVFLSGIQVLWMWKKKTSTQANSIYTRVLKKCRNISDNFCVNNFSEATTLRQINAFVYYWKSDKMKSIQRCQYAV